MGTSLNPVDLASKASDAALECIDDLSIPLDGVIKQIESHLSNLEEDKLGHIYSKLFYSRLEAIIEKGIDGLISYVLSYKDRSEFMIKETLGLLTDLKNESIDISSRVLRQIKELGWELYFDDETFKWFYRPSNH